MMRRLISFAWILACLGWTTQTSAAVNAAPPQGAALLKTDILGVFAHPDDETGVATTMAYYALHRDLVVSHVYCTRGEGGGNMVGTQAGAALGILREAELRDCLLTLGVRHWYFLDCMDWAYTESASATLEHWGKEQTLERLVCLVRSLRPEVMVTMNPAPRPGQHGHHQAAGILAIEAFKAAADPTRFPEQLKKEGLQVWQTRKLYYRGVGGKHIATIDANQPLPDGREPAEIAARALANHRSQGFGNFASSPWMRRPQPFTLVKSVVPFAREEFDLMRGISPNNQPRFMGEMIPVVDRSPGLQLEFVPRPAVVRYRAWVREQNIGHATDPLSADLPVVMGEENHVQLQLKNETTSAVRGTMTLQGPEHWIVEPAEISYKLDPAGQWQYLVKVVPPAEMAEDAVLEAELRAEQGTPLLEAKAQAILHPVPTMNVPRVESPMPVDGSTNAWGNIPYQTVSPQQRVQGQSEDEADSSAAFRLAHDGRNLYLDAMVRDDRVVRNIAPDDIKGHWRSDSVEVCLEPNVMAEDTLRSFKLGIFPFDSEGHVRAARDADANQGPIEQTAPGTRLFSSKTSSGYHLQAAIPFGEIGVVASSGLGMAFNLILYDGDKEDAAPGENINESRLAWSPRPGVQGRPEDWGRIVLE